MPAAASSTFKLALLGHMLVGLRRVSSENMSVLKRKAAIKRAAYMAMAAARGGGARWSRALLAGLSNNNCPAAGSAERAGRMERRLRDLPHHVRGGGRRNNKIVSRILRKPGRARKRPPAPRRAASASLLARRILKKRTQVLRRLVPGGQALDRFSLLEETLDYVLFLRAQVDLMRSLTPAAGLPVDSTRVSSSGKRSRECP